MAVKVFNYGGGLDELSKAIPAAIQGYQDAEDRQLKRLALVAEMTAREERIAKEKARDERSQRSEGRAVTGLQLKLRQALADPNIPPSQKGIIQQQLMDLEGGQPQVQPQGLMAQRGGLVAQQPTGGFIQSQDPFLSPSAQAGVRKGQAQAEKAEIETQRARKGRELPAARVNMINEGQLIPLGLDEISQTIENNPNLFGPVAGRKGQLNPYDTKAQSIDAQLRAYSQQFGRFMEGGVLRKEDEEKYRKMFPNLTDTPEIAKNKLQVVRRLLANKYNSEIETLKGQGFNIEGFERLKVPEIPKDLRGSEKKFQEEIDTKVWEGKTYKKVGNKWVEQ